MNSSLRIILCFAGLALPLLVACSDSDPVGQTSRTSDPPASVLGTWRLSSLDSDTSNPSHYDVAPPFMDVTFNADGTFDLFACDGEHDHYDGTTASCGDGGMTSSNGTFVYRGGTVWLDGGNLNGGLGVGTPGTPVVTNTNGISIQAIWATSFGRTSIA